MLTVRAIVELLWMMKQESSIKFMLGDAVYCEVLSDNSYCIDMLFSSIKGEIISRYITNEIRLKDKDFYFRITDIEGNIFDIY